MANQCLAKLEHVSLRLDQREILHDINLEVYPERVLTLIGPNGAGKSSVLKVLLRLLPPSGGTVWQKPQLRIGYVPQRFRSEPLMPLTVERFMRLGTRSLKGKTAEQVLEQVDLVHVLSQSLTSLSGGEMQRVLLARAMLQQPEMLVLDEPGQGVDVVGLSDLYRLLARLKREYGYGIVLVSHDLHLVMAATDQVLCLNTHVCCSGQPDAVSQHPEYLRLFGRQEEVAGLAVYTHHHDHHHNLQGEVISDQAHQHDGSCQHSDDVTSPQRDEI